MNGAHDYQEKLRRLKRLQTDLARYENDSIHAQKKLQEQGQQITWVAGHDWTIEELRSQKAQTEKQLQQLSTAIDSTRTDEVIASRREDLKREQENLTKLQTLNNELERLGSLSQTWLAIRAAQNTREQIAACKSSVEKLELVEAEVRSQYHAWLDIQKRIETRLKLLKEVAGLAQELAKIFGVKDEKVWTNIAVTDFPILNKKIAKKQVELEKSWQQSTRSAEQVKAQTREATKENQIIQDRIQPLQSLQKQFRARFSDSESLEENNWLVEVQKLRELTETEEEELLPHSEESLLRFRQNLQIQYNYLKWFEGLFVGEIQK
jgi:hypothetical protein